MTYRDGFLNVVGLGLAILTGLVMKAQHHLGPLLLTWFNFNPSMDK